jgi:hypothetical protein
MGSTRIHRILEEVGAIAFPGVFDFPAASPMRSVNQTRPRPSSNPPGPAFAAQGLDHLIARLLAHSYSVPA